MLFQLLYFIFSLNMASSAWLTSGCAIFLFLFTCGVSIVVTVDVIIPTTIPHLVVFYDEKTKPLGARVYIASLAEHTGLFNLAILCLLTAIGVPCINSDREEWGALGTILTIWSAGSLTSAIFYYNHRSLHRSKWAYSVVHAVHHNYKEPFALAGFHTHWMDLIWTNMLPVMVPIIFCCLTRRVAIAYVNLAILDTLLAHIQYKGKSDVLNLVFGLTRFHLDHHLHWNKNMGLTNGVLDRLHGTHIR